MIKPVEKAPKIKVSVKVISLDEVEKLRRKRNILKALLRESNG